MRSPASRYPSLYQINTRVWLTELSQTQGRPAMLDAIPDAELDRVAGSWPDTLQVDYSNPAILLFSIADTGVRGSPPVVTAPTN